MGIEVFHKAIRTDGAHFGDPVDVVDVGENVTNEPETKQAMIFR